MTQNRTTSRRGPTRSVLLVVAALSTACNATSFQTARTMDAGKTKFYVAPSAMRIAIAGRPTTLPFVEFGTRYGLTDDVEIGGHIGAGIGFDAKIALYRPATPTDAWDISLAPGIGYIGGFSGTPTGGDAMHFFGATLPVMLTRHVGDRLAITLGPRLMYLLQGVSGDGAQSTHILSIGSSLGLGVRITDTFWIVPGVAVALPVVRTLSNFGTDAGVGNQRLFQFGIGFSFGG